MIEVGNCERLKGTASKTIGSDDTFARGQNVGTFAEVEWGDAMKRSFANCAKWSLIALSLLVFLSAAALADDCARIERLGTEWGANLSAYRSAKQKYTALSNAERVPARCDSWKSYLQYLQNAKRMVEEGDRNKCPTKFSNIECNAACFAARIQDAEKQVQRTCSGGSTARAHACAAAVDKYNNAHAPLHKRQIDSVKKSISLEFDKKDKAAATKVECEGLKWSWSTYHPFLRRELKAMEEACGDDLYDFFDKETYQGHGADHFTHTQPAITRKALAEICGINADTLAIAAPPPAAAPSSAVVTLSRPGASASCSDITGTSSTAPRPQCATARKALQGARDDHQKYPERAAKKYKEAADAYRQAGDQPRAVLALREATAKDPAPFVEAEADLAQRQKNIEDAENNARIARKIEEGAFESGSCGDLQRAADYYLDAAKYFLRADQFAAVNAILLRKDHLERLVDEAKAKGLCGNRLKTRRTAGVSTTAEEQLPDNQCRAILDHIKRVPDLQEGKQAAVLKVELAAKGCKNPDAAVTGPQCEIANLAWAIRDVGPAQRESRLKAAGCPCEIRGGEIINCESAKPKAASAAQPTDETFDWRSWLWGKRKP